MAQTVKFPAQLAPLGCVGKSWQSELGVWGPWGQGLETVGVLPDLLGHLEVSADGSKAARSFRDHSAERQQLSERRLRASAQGQLDPGPLQVVLAAGSWQLM